MTTEKKFRKLTDEEAQEMLDHLSDHFNQRVAPVNEYCRGFYDYMSALRAAAKRDGVDRWPIVKYFGEIDALLHKSNLAARLIYVGEKLRSRKCPKHDGSWSGVPLSATMDCPHGCNLTGWIREPEDGGPPHGSDPSTWKNTGRWRIRDFETGETQEFSYEEMLEREKQEAEERERKRTEESKG